MNNAATHRCPVCNSPIEQRTRGRRRIYCCDSCKQTAYEERNDIPAWKERKRAVDAAGRPEHSALGTSFELDRELARKSERDRQSTYTSKEVLRGLCKQNPSYCVEVVVTDPMLCATVLCYLSTLIRGLEYPTEDPGWAACYQAILELRSSVDFITGAVPIGAVPTTPMYNRGDPDDESR